VNPEQITFEKNRCNLNEPWYPNDDEPHPRYGYDKYLVCDVCGKKVLAQPANFCPSCGAKNHNDCMD
jgi:rubrerythrin